MSCWIKVSLVSGCLAATFTIVLAISVVYIFDVEKDNVVTGECTVQTCNVFYTQCPVTTCSGSGSNRRCTTYEEGCFIATIIFTLNTTDSTYIATDANQYLLESLADTRCNNYREGSLITCYYDMRSPGSTLGLNPSRAEAGGIAAIVIFTVFDAIFLAIFVISVILSPKPDFHISMFYMHRTSLNLLFNKKIENIQVTDMPQVPPV